MQKPFIPAFLFALLVFFGCSKSDPAQKAADTWYISYFLDTGDKVEDTGLFTGYTFEFNDDSNWLIHAPDGSTSTGQWKVDDASGDATLRFDNATSPINAIIGNYDVTEHLDSSLKLKRQPDTGTSALDEIPVLEFTKQ